VSIFETFLQKIHEISLDSDVLDFLLALNAVGSKRAQAGDVLKVESEHHAHYLEVEGLLLEGIKI
jgi:hypothetical protein